MKDKLFFIVSSILEKTDKISIEEQDSEGITQLVIHVADDEIGKVIGKNGKVIRAIRNAMRVPATKHNVRVNVSLAAQQPIV